MTYLGFVAIVIGWFLGRTVGEYKDIVALFDLELLPWWKRVLYAIGVMIEVDSSVVYFSIVASITWLIISLI